MTADQIARDLCRVIDDVPVVFKLAGVEYTGTRGSLVTTKQLVSGGVFEAPELTITTSLKKVYGNKLVNRFPTDEEPECQDVLQAVGGVAGRDYKIIRTHLDEYGVGLQMDLESVHK